MVLPQITMMGGIRYLRPFKCLCSFWWKSRLAFKTGLIYNIITRRFKFISRKIALWPWITKNISDTRVKKITHISQISNIKKRFNVLEDQPALGSFGFSHLSVSSCTMSFLCHNSPNKLALWDESESLQISLRSHVFAASLFASGAKGGPISILIYFTRTLWYTYNNLTQIVYVELKLSTQSGCTFIPI